MRILIPGGSGQVGTMLARALHARGEMCLSCRARRPNNLGELRAGTEG